MLYKQKIKMTVKLEIVKVVERIESRLNANCESLFLLFIFMKSIEAL